MTGREIDQVSVTDTDDNKVVLRMKGRSQEGKALIDFDKIISYGCQGMDGVVRGVGRYPLVDDYLVSV